MLGAHHPGQAHGLLIDLFACSQTTAAVVPRWEAGAVGQVRTASKKGEGRGEGLGSKTWFLRCQEVGLPPPTNPRPLATSL